MILEIVKYGHPALRTKGAPVGTTDAKIEKLVTDMIETMHAANGVGLAAHQVGVPIQLCVIDVEDFEDRPSTMSVDDEEVDLNEYMPLALLNPVLKLSQECETGSEGCLSFPEINADIVRSEGVLVKAQTLDGDTIEFEATGLLARALQHEVDHLNGVLFIDRMNSAVKASLSGKLKRLQKETRG